ncbi:tryptophan synthase subunit alpha [Sulfurospirillum sp. 1612]|uniref:tryptophan synthase subunit alpha n=1 Tax=Sulfurospirillum sp. 1612 TaxID=3094835 RepID=UPI002F92D04C
MKKLIAYITAGYPDPNFTTDLALSLQEAGVDILELGIAFSDPVADGPVIEEANLRSLQQGFKMKKLYDMTQEIAPKMETFWMGYFNSFYAQGVQNISQIARDLGVKGFIIPDLPHEESRVYQPIFQQHQLSLVNFVAPTDGKARIAKIIEKSQGFIYLVAYAGITGSGTAEDLSSVISEIKATSQTPLYIGFGVDEKSAKEKSKGVDGVIVGSAFVKVLLDDSLSHSEKIKKICAKARVIKEAIN